jgi:hypothetical protein
MGHHYILFTDKFLVGDPKAMPTSPIQNGKADGAVIADAT